MARGEIGYQRRMETAPYQPRLITIMVTTTVVVSGLLLIPDRPKACLILAHGAGAGMTHHFMVAVAEGLNQRGVATLRYQFPYMERDSRRPDAPRVAQATVRAAVEEANRQVPGLPLYAGGKSFGGRMTSQSQAAAPLPGIRGLAFLGFPLHAAGKPSVDRAQHLLDVQVPMLFLQGTRDALAQPDLVRQVAGGLGDKASVAMFPDADHSFHVPARSGRTDEEMRADMLDTLEDWIVRSIGGSGVAGH